MVDGQQWGIFCIEFDSNKFEVSALRKILSTLVPRRRSSVDHTVWEQQDLLFICNWGEDNNRTIGIAHFEDREKGLPQIKMISCAPALEDFTQIKVFEDRLSLLAWPKNPGNIDAWREDWSNAFFSGYRQTIQDSSTLTIKLAAEAQEIRNRILATLAVETKNGYVHLLYDKFRDTLIHDMTEQQFADMYAQTVVYGLFSARCMDSTQDDFSADEAIECIPGTNPFLKSLMRECLGSHNSNKLSFDELEIGNVVELLLHSKTDEIIKDFNRQTGGGREDPVIHFYEEFLTAYDKTQKVQRGVYYTPQPVVNFIVRAVDSILKTEFGYEDGLASTETKKIKVMRDSHRRVNGYKTQVEEQIEVPAVQILDPATGTGTFLRQTILQIYENFQQKHKGEPKAVVAALWNKYVDESLLPRLNGFELMMAPYAVAHMKLAMVLKDTGYDFSGEHRLNVFLTNSLEKAGNSDNQLTLFDDPLATESIEANKAKKNRGISILIGNPPYSGESANNGAWIQELMEDYKKEPGGQQKLQEQNSKWINDDYVKFIRYAQTFIDNSEAGILAYINPHGFLDNPTFRGMRWKLMQSFTRIYVLDLHGNAKKKEICPDGSKDENVFDIQQGVCILLAVKGKRTGKSCSIYHADLYGVRESKYQSLNNLAINTLDWKEVSPAKEMFFFIEQDMSLSKKWDRYFKVEEAFPLNGVGICSKRDTIAFHDSKEELTEVLHDFESLTEEEIKLKYNVTSESRDQKVSYAKSNVIDYGIKDDYLKQCLYRPFDLKWTYYTDKVRGFLAYPVYKVLSHMLYDNVGLIISRQGQASDLSNWNVVFATDRIVDLNIFRRGGGCLFPLYLYTYNMGRWERIPNLNKQVTSTFEQNLGLRYKTERTDDSHDYFAPCDFWAYIYAILFSKHYREKYKEFLNLDFPRIPYICDEKKFWMLAEIGNELKNIHLMKPSYYDASAASINSGTNIIEKITFKESAVFINKTQRFYPVPDDIWNFQIGGYQPLEKWLKDRKGRPLSEEDKLHYVSIVGALIQTKKCMEKIDSIVDDLI
ncbi:MAG: DNA methyltransferase [Lachnospiraceae bacterium]|nr:DNA methyltransferase [Lachnospiraceae bacterium]